MSKQKKGACIGAAEKFIFMNIYTPNKMKKRQNRKENDNMTNIIYEKQTINWEQKTRYKKQNDANKQWKTVNKKKATRYGYYEKGASNKHTVNWLRNQCHDHDYDIVA